MRLTRLTVTTGLLAAFAIETAATYVVHATQPFDRAVLLRVFRFADRPSVHPVLIDITDLGGPIPVAFGAVAVTGAALVLRGREHAARSALAIVGANVTTQVLQTALAQPRSLAGFADHVWLYPSGHTTGVASVGLGAAVLFKGRTSLAIGGAGAALVAATAAALVLLGAHLLSDVVAAVLVVAAWACAVGPGPTR